MREINQSVIAYRPAALDERFRQAMKDVVAPPSPVLQLSNESFSEEMSLAPVLSQWVSPTLHRSS